MQPHANTGDTGTQVRSLGLEDPLAKGMAARSSQYSRLENSMARGAWWAAAHGGHREST